MRTNSWSLVSKVMSTKLVSCEGVSDAIEPEDLDIKLLVLKSSKANNVQIQDALKLVEALESSMREIEDVLDCISRSLVENESFPSQHYKLLRKFCSLYSRIAVYI
ncbi:hypothetical protein CDL15_Pgr014284 [Punica granatum]|uniref:Uncharacterized protein n=1 Tax=Punica granatum TaxID=22663 RepID=A0A218WEH0_PUNGR|nr:hypothetical protein CDL15_Pgr014284 [Punica granatum]